MRLQQGGAMTTTRSGMTCASARGPICEDLIERGPICEDLIERGAICEDLHERARAEM